MRTKYSTFLKTIRGLKSGLYFDYAKKKFFFFLGLNFLTKTSLVLSEKFFIEYVYLKVKKYLIQLNTLITPLKSNNLTSTFLILAAVLLVLLFFLKNVLTGSNHTEQLHKSRAWVVFICPYTYGGLFV